jgi:hypothetical protein
MPGEDEAWRRAEQQPHPGSLIPTPGGTYVPEYRPEPPRTPAGGGMGAYADGAAQAIRDGANAYAAQRSPRIAEAAANAYRDTQRFVFHGTTGPAFKPYQPFVPTSQGGPVFVPTWHPPIVWPHSPPPQGFHFWPTYTPRGPELRPRDPSKGLPPPPAKVDKEGFFVLPAVPKIDAEGFYVLPAAPKAKAQIGFGIGGGVAAVHQDYDDATVMFTFGATVWAGTDGKEVKERGLDHPRLTTFDKVLADPTELVAAIDAVAKEFGIDPGLLAACGLHEDDSGWSYWHAGAVSSIVGVDGWDKDRVGVTARVPAAGTIKSHRMTDAEAIYYKTTKEFKNEHGTVVGFNRVFEGRTDGLRAVAATLKALEIRLAQRAGGDDRWQAIPVGERIALMRWSYNRGPAEAFAAAPKAADGYSILKRTGPLFLRDASGNIKLNDWGKQMHDPLRHATQAAGQAIHISQTFFGTKYPPTERMTWDVPTRR